MFNTLLSALNGQKSVKAISDLPTIRTRYRYWRIRIMYSMMTGYAVFYFLRKNFSMAMPTFLNDMGFTKTDLGLILTLFSLIYGIGKFLNGVLADKANARYFMIIGLFGSAIINILFGMSYGLISFGILWIINAWFQSMGWPPCARLLTHWYGRKELGTAWGIWNASHQIGGAGILILAGYLIPNYGWRSSFYVPAALAIVTCIFLVERLRDTPQSLGLPEIEKYNNDPEPQDEFQVKDASYESILFNRVLKNKWVWCVSLANFFVYIVRIGVLDWAPTFLVEAKGASLKGAGLQVATFEIAGIFGALIAGWLSDRAFKGNRGLVNSIFMLILIACLFYFWKIPAGFTRLNILALVSVGFLIYGPQMLAGVASAEFASKKAAATATGMTGLFGYLGSSVCGLGTGLIVDRWGWDGGFVFFIGSAVVGLFLFLLTLRHYRQTGKVKCDLKKKPNKADENALEAQELVPTY